MSKPIVMYVIAGYKDGNEKEPKILAAVSSYERAMEVMTEANDKQDGYVYFIEAHDLTEDVEVE